MAGSAGRCAAYSKVRPEAPHSGRVRAGLSGRTGSSYALLIVATSPGWLFLSGLLASIARLRFTGTPILKPFRDRAQ